MRWKNTEATKVAQLLTTEMWCRSPSADIQIAPRLEVKSALLVPLMVYPEKFELPVPLGPGDKQQIRIFCWSPTRNHFTLRARESRDDPCFEISSRPMTTAESQELIAQWETSRDFRFRFRFGYTVVVNIYETRNKDARLDLGPLNRKIEILSSDFDKPFVSNIVGEVKGGVLVRSDKGVGKIAFKSFPRDRGTRIVASLSSDQPGLEFQLDTVEPATLKPAFDVQLQPTEGSRATNWQMAVRVLPDKTHGPFPEDAAIILKTRGDSPRRIRIPISGEAYLPIKGSQKRS
jgi:hypothetical protein